MNLLIVYAHPEPGSFTGALKDTAVKALEEAGHSVEVTDLYKENFNPVAGRHDFKSVKNPDYFHYQAEQEYASETKSFSEDIAREQERMRKADLLVFVFPLWWGGIPAILKGWIDRVLAYGFAYVDGHRFETGLFKGRKGIFGVSTGGTKQRFSDGERGTYGEIENVLYPVNHCVIKYFGLELMDPFVAYAAPRLSLEKREDYLNEWKSRLLDIVNDSEWQKEREKDSEQETEKVIVAKQGWSSSN